MIMNRREEHNEKIARVRTWLAAHKMEGALFTTQGNFSWITAGGEAHVSLGGDTAVGNILVTQDRVVLLTNVIERSRLLEEELSDLGIDSVTWPWYESGGIEEAAAKFASLSKIMVDRPHGTPFAYVEGMVELRYVLLSMEVDRYRRLAHDAAEVVEGVCRSVIPGQTELEVAALVAKGCMERGVLPLVNLVAADDRIKRYRHPLPTKKSVQNTVMVVLTGRRNGLHASLTRIVAFGKLDGSIQRRHQSVTKVDAAYILGSRPGRALNEVLADGLRIYEAEDYPDEWELHHQGGLTGYAGREIFATPSATYRLSSSQCLAWNPSITGTKSEDTILITNEGTEILTQTDGWPHLEVSMNGKKVVRPDILVL